MTLRAANRRKRGIKISGSAEMLAVSRTVAADGRGLRYLEWRWDPDPADNTYLVEYAFLLRESDGSVMVEHDRHTEGLFPRADWLVWFEEAGLTPRTARDAAGREIFLGTPRAVADP